MVTTQAAVLRAADGPFQIETVEVNEPTAGEVVVQIAGVGICHTDFLPRTPVAKPPIVVGHEGAGTIVAVGPGVTNRAVGDRVILSFDHCGQCRNCGDGQPGYCREFWPRNMSGYRAGRSTTIRDENGEAVMGQWFGQSSFAEYAVVKATNTVPVDPSLPIELLGPLSCGVMTGAGSVFTSLDVRPGNSLAVFGTGTVGLSAIMAARVAGATRIVAVDRNPDRLALAQKFGATDTVVSDSGDLTSAIKALAPDGLDFSLDTTGVPEVITAAIDALRMRGVCGCVGVQLKPLVLQPNQLALGRTVKGILVGDASPHQLIPRLIELWQAGRFPFDDLIETFPLSAIDAAEQAMNSGRVIKPVLIPKPASSTPGTPKFTKDQQ
ncbi:MAG: NAD(P)-dependent alcohol dehydrogenase [Gordonia sp. (in: high G+C Gram-positive bacteria)]|uniref:NAD(P)-dependent alcohol dehydrogenase n=1 Tax=Gordonia sp. (in: high G+C Gram-positive bacteria) TaxID=84139 RepID=UPI003C78ED64